MIKRFNILAYCYAAFSALTTNAVQEFYIHDVTITCKTGEQARSVGDFPVQSALQFLYTTQDHYSCLVVELEESSPSPQSAHVVVLNYAERRGIDPITKTEIAKTPHNYGYKGNYQFMYTTFIPKSGERYWGFVDYGTNEKIRNFFETIKKNTQAVDAHEKQHLYGKPPATMKALQGLGAIESK